jgi:DNA-binding IclR family transcriptional regulator
MKELTEELKLELYKLLQPTDETLQPNGFTNEEIRNTLGITREKTQRLLRELKSLGALEVCQVYREDIDGSYSKRPAYIILFDKIVSTT